MCVISQPVSRENKGIQLRDHYRILIDLTNRLWGGTMKEVLQFGRDCDCREFLEVILAILRENQLEVHFCMFYYIYFLAIG